MNIKRLTLSLLFLLLTAGAPQAKPVDAATASRVAQAVLQKEVTDATPAAFLECYLFVGTDGTGYALVAADDCVRPLLGYSLTDIFPSQTLPDHIASWLEAYCREIAAFREVGIEGSAKVQKLWSLYLSNKHHTPRQGSVGPLLTTRWNQGYPYNLLCPQASDGRYSVTGCVATATAQVMKYWNHPAVGRGSHSYTPEYFSTRSANFDTTHYDWAHMPDAPGSTSSDTERIAVAQLMYHVGVAVEMNYRPESSGAFVSSYGDPAMASSENALKNHFRYNQALFSAHREALSDAAWDALISRELDLGRPVVYSGSDRGSGHAFVIDGYDSTGFFHVNWGWGGYCDGYYTIDSLNPDGSGIGGNATNGYNQNNAALLNVYPVVDTLPASVSIVSNDTTMGTVSGGGTFAPYTQATLTATAAEGYRFESWKNGNRYNPFIFKPNHDYSDTALFVPVAGDTLGYCNNRFFHLWGEYPSEWGIRLAATSIASHRQLEYVQLYTVAASDYTLTVYRGATPNRPAYSETYILGNEGWHTLPIASPLPLYSGEPLWLVFSNAQYSNPVTVSSYSGNPDGCWFKRNGSWTHLTDIGDYGTWMIRAILGELQPVTLTVTSSDDNRGTATGSGTYYPGDTAWLTATPAQGYRFAGWSTGDTDNPLAYRVTVPEQIFASFLPSTGIDDIGNPEVEINISGLDLTISNPLGSPVALYDIQGRLLSTLHAPLSTLRLPAPGVYILRADGQSPVRIVAINQ